MNSPETDRLKSSLIPVGAENVLYITIPYKGCPLKCVFCGVREKMDRALKIDGGFGGKVFDFVQEEVDRRNPDSVVLYNGGNILRPAEMDQETMISAIPNFISAHPNCQTYEIEVRSDHVLKYVESIKTINKNLGDKKLRVRLGIEFMDNHLLKSHKKGIRFRKFRRRWIF